MYVRSWLITSVPEPCLWSMCCLYIGSVCENMNVIYDKCDDGVQQPEEARLFLPLILPLGGSEYTLIENVAQ